jgi:uncharacterized protein YukE
MDTLNMEVEQTKGLKTSMDSQKEIMDSKLGELTTSITGMVNVTWKGNSAEEFGGQYETLRGAISNQIGKISELAGRLQNEIAEWEAAAAKLG